MYVGFPRSGVEKKVHPFGYEGVDSIENGEDVNHFVI